MAEIETPTPANDPDNVVFLGKYRMARRESERRARGPTYVSPDRALLGALIASIALSERPKDRVLLRSIKTLLDRYAKTDGLDPEGFMGARTMLDAFVLLPFG